MPMTPSDRPFLNPHLKDLMNDAGSYNNVYEKGLYRKKFSRCAGHFGAKSYMKRAYISKKFPAARAISERNPKGLYLSRKNDET